MTSRFERGVLCPAAIAAAALGLFGSSGGAAPPGQADTRADAARRRAMVAEQIAARGVRDPRVLRAMRTVPRHLFVPPALREQAYLDQPLPIGADQTISQPYMVAFMTEALRIRPGDKVLEVGTGSGYQAAVLAEAGAEVFSIEILDELAARARETLARAGYGRVRVRTGDGFHGWPEEAPFDAVIVTAAAGEIPRPLLDQVRDGGRLLLPLETGGESQVLTLVEKTAGETRARPLLPVRFVPMTGKIRRR